MYIATYFGGTPSMQRPSPPHSSLPCYFTLTGFFIQFFTQFFTHLLIRALPTACFPASQFFLPSFVIDLSRNSWMLFGSFSAIFACLSGHTRL